MRALAMFLVVVAQSALAQVPVEPRPRALLPLERFKAPNISFVCLDVPQKVGPALKWLHVLIDVEGKRNYIEYFAQWNGGKSSARLERAIKQVYYSEPGAEDYIYEIGAAGNVKSRLVEINLDIARLFGRLRANISVSDGAQKFAAEGCVASVGYKNRLPENIK